jgi:esterase/lipase
VKTLLLHGAIGSSKQLILLQNQLITDGMEVHVMNFSGHGGNESESGFSIELFASDVIEFLESQSNSCVNVFGYSMGGYVALYLARHYPERINRVATLATKFNWTKDSAEKESKMIDPEVILRKIPEFAAKLEQSHAPADWKVVLQKTQAMMLQLGENPVLADDDLVSIKQKVLLTVGDNDKMVSIEETKRISEIFPDGYYFIFPDTKHPIESVNTTMLAEKIIGFFS